MPSECPTRAATFDARRCPVRTCQTGDDRAIGVRSRQDVVLIRLRRSGPLSVDHLSAFVQEDRRGAGTPVQLRQVVGDERERGVVPRAGADPVARVRRLVIVRGIALHAEVRPPLTRAVPGRRGQALTRRIGAREAAQISRRAGLARHEEADGRPGRGRRHVITAAHQRRQHRTYEHTVSHRRSPFSMSWRPWRDCSPATGSRLTLSQGQEECDEDRTARRRIS